MTMQHDTEKATTKRTTIEKKVLDRACVLLSPPLSVSDRTEGADENTLTTVLGCLKGLRSHEEALGLARALTFRVGIASSAGEDRLGAWLLLDGIFDAFSSKKVILGENGAHFASYVLRSLADLIRCRWDSYALNKVSNANRFLARHYERLENKWLCETTPVFEPKQRRKLEAAFKEIRGGKLKDIESFAALKDCDNSSKDCLWKLRRDDARPVISRQLYTLFGGKSRYPPTNGVAEIVDKVTGKVIGTETEELSDLVQPLHPKLLQWMEKLKEEHGGCAECDTFSHRRAACPSLKTRVAFSSDEAVDVLHHAGCSNPTHPDTMEVFDLISKEMSNHRPYHHLLTAFDILRRSTTAPAEQSALSVVSSYCLKPSLLREKYIPSDNYESDLEADLRYNEERIEPNTVVQMMLPNAVIKHFTDRCRFEELKTLRAKVRQLRNAFFAADNSARSEEEELTEWIKDIRMHRMPLFAYFDKNAQGAVAGAAIVPPTLPSKQVWDRQLRRVSAHCAKMCRKCLSLEHVTDECANVVTYDQAAARDALQYHKFYPRPLTSDTILDIEDKIKYLREKGGSRSLLESHRLEMALRILVPQNWRGGNGPKDSDRVASELCATCQHYGHHQHECRAFITALFDGSLTGQKRGSWPFHELSVTLFPAEIKKVHRNPREDWRDEATLRYAKTAKVPKEYGDAIVQLAADNGIFPVDKEDANVLHFSPAMVRYHPALVRDILRLTGRDSLVDLINVVMMPEGPEPCLFCGTLGHSSLRCRQHCSPASQAFLRGLHRHSLTLPTFLDQKTQLAKMYLKALKDRKSGVEHSPTGGTKAQHSEEDRLDLENKGLEKIYEALAQLGQKCKAVGEAYQLTRPVSKMALPNGGGAPSTTNGSGFSQSQRPKFNGLDLTRSKMHLHSNGFDAVGAIAAGDENAIGAAGLDADGLQSTEFDDQLRKAADVADLMATLGGSTSAGAAIDTSMDVTAEIAQATAELEAQFPEFRGEDEPARKKQRVE